MRTLAKFTLDVAAANESIKRGELPEMIERCLASLEPESAYFYADGGLRTALVVFDLKDPSDIPAVAEPWFLAANARVEFFPVMNTADLKAGLQKFLRQNAVPA